MNTQLDAEDFAILALALGMLRTHVDRELEKARSKSNNAKLLAMFTMRTRVFTVHAKLQALQGGAS